MWLNLRISEALPVTCNAAVPLESLEWRMVGMEGSAWRGIAGSAVGWRRVDRRNTKKIDKIFWIK